MKPNTKKIITICALLGIVAVFLSTLAIPNFVAYRKRGHNSAANADVKNVYTAAQAYLTDNPGETITMDKLRQAGYKGSEGVELTIVGKTRGDLKIVSKHSAGSETYSVDVWGED